VSSYRPAGAVSNYLHGLKPGDTVLFKHTAGNVKLPYVHPVGWCKLLRQNDLELVLKVPVSELEQKKQKILSRFPFKFNLRHFNPVTGVAGFCSGGGGGGGHSTTAAPVTTITMCAVGVGIAPMVGRRSLEPVLQAPGFSA